LQSRNCFAIGALMDPAHNMDRKTSSKLIRFPRFPRFPRSTRTRMRIRVVAANIVNIGGHD